jgi:hypothetical protein
MTSFSTFQSQKYPLAQKYRVTEVLRIVQKAFNRAIKIPQNNQPFPAWSIERFCLIPSKHGRAAIRIKLFIRTTRLAEIPPNPPFSKGGEGISFWKGMEGKF